MFLPGSPEKRLYARALLPRVRARVSPRASRRRRRRRRFLARDIDDSVPERPDDDPTDRTEEGDARERFGFLTLHGEDAGFTFEDRIEDYPEAWIQYDAAGNPKLKPYYRQGPRRGVPRRARRQRMGSGARAWFLPGKFRFCLRCGDRLRVSASRDRNRLASLSAEGRSSATTVLVGSVLRWMHGPKCGLDADKRKLLGFTDNRQDAALQAGHFNDFLFVSLVRAGFLGALLNAGSAGLRAEQLGGAQQKALGFDRKTAEARAEWLHEPDLKGFNLHRGRADAA